MSLNRGKFEFGVVLIHGLDLLLGRCTQDLDDFHQLVYPTFTGKERLPEHQLSHNTPCGPNIDAGSVVGRTKDQLWSPIVSRANVRYVWLSGDQDFCTT